MNKKHFIALADAIRDSPVEFTPEHLKVLADFCQASNIRFDRDKWLLHVSNTRLKRREGLSN